MPKEKITKENLYICYNSLISISSISETNINRFSKYLLRIENLEQTLLLKKCAVQLSDFSDLKESLFFIRELEEENDDKEMNDNIKELMENKRINYNQKFILQHMLSQKYISLDILPGNNNYNLKLTSDKDCAVPFILKRIHENRNSQEFLTFKQSFYLSIYIKGKDQFYYINYNSYTEKPPEYDVDSLVIEQKNLYVSNENIISKNKKQINNIEEKENDTENGYSYFYENFSELCIEKKMNCKYIFLNQSWYIKYEDKLYSSHIINIIFINSNLYKDSNKNNLLSEKEEKLMLSAEYIDNLNAEEAASDMNQGNFDSNEKIKKKKNEKYFYDENKGLISLDTKKKNFENQIRVKLVPFENDLYKHVLNNSFWVIEEELTDSKERLDKLPLKEGAQIKIKNVLLGLYLKVKKRGNEMEMEENQNEDENNSNGNIDNIKNSVNEEEEAEYEFELVDEETLINNNFFFSNFKIFHYSINEKNNYMSYKGKYSLRNLFKDDKNEVDDFDFEEINKYFQPLSINLDSEKKYYLLSKNEDDYIFEIKKVDIFEANHVIYMSKLIKNFNYYLEKCIKKEIHVGSAIKVIVLNLSFFINYLINVEYIFIDENYELNEPIEQRQVILENYGVLKIIKKIGEYLLPIISDMNLKNKNDYQMRNSNYNRINNKNNLLYSSLINNNESLNNNHYHLDTFSEKINSSHLNIENMKNLIKIILDFLMHLSNNNEEIKEKIFVDLDIILELAEKVFVLDKSILLNFIFKLIKNSEVLQEYITGGKSNLLFTIKNSKQYTKYAEKERQNKLIRIDKILMYIETSNNYLYYYKKLLKLNKVKHKKKKIKQLIIEHMTKVDNEYKNKYNYKNNLINIINRTKKILKRIENPLIKKAENDDKIAEKELNKSKIRKSLLIKKKKIENNNEEEKSEKEIINFEDNLISDNNDLTKKIKKNEKDQNEKNKKVINLLQDWIGPGDNEENDSFSLINNDSQKDEKISKKKTIEENLQNIKIFLYFFEGFNINNILFIHEKCYEELFNSFNDTKNFKKNLDFMTGRKDISITLIDGIKLEFNSELGHLIPFKLFNSFFLKFPNKSFINKYINNINCNINNTIDEDSENDLYNNNELIQEKQNELDDGIINNNNKINKLNNKNKQFKIEESDFSKVFSLQNNISNNIITNQLNLRANNNKIVRHSGTNPQLIKNKIINNFNVDESLLVPIAQKGLDEDLNKLNKYLCILYTTYQFCINEFYECLLTIFNMLNNYYINYSEFCDIQLLMNNLKRIKGDLIIKIAFINNDVLNNLYSAARRIRPTLLKGIFDFDNFLVSCSKTDITRINSLDENIGIDEFFLTNNKYDKSISNMAKNKIKENMKLKDLTSEEITLIKSLFSFCKKYDKLNYMIDKINYFRNIKQLINNVQDNKITTALKSSDTLTTNEPISIMNNKNNLKNKININNNENKNCNKEFSNIIEQLNEKRNLIISAYIDINNYKKFLKSSLKNQKDKNLKYIKPIGYDVNKRLEIIIRLMMKYEIDNIFGKLIYLGNNKNIIYLENDILKNFKSVQNNFQYIKNEIKKIKIDYDRRGDNCLKIIKDENNNLISQLSLYDSDFNKNHFQELNKFLEKMTNSFLNFLCLNNNGIAKLKSMPKLDQILYKENDYFYKKIGFEKIMQSLIEAIDYFYDFNRNPLIKLNYCQEILRIFLEIQNIYRNFKETIPEYFELYYKMIISSLHTINLYQDNLIGKEEEKYFLKICFYSCESFMIVIFNSKKNFNELRGFMIDILSKLLKLYHHLKNPKNRIIFQILYTYYISRVLLFISKEKYLDEFSYNSFFQIIYPMDKMHEQVTNCIKELEKNDEDEEEEDSSEEKENTEDNNILNENNKKNIKMSNISTYSHNLNQKSNLNNINNDVNKNKINIIYPENIINSNINDTGIIWENDEEKEKFCFYLNYLSIYLLYLHDRNSMKKVRDNVNEEIIFNSKEYNYKNLYTKIEKLLGDKNNQNIIKDNFQDNLNLQTFNSNEISQKIKVSNRESTLNSQNFVKKLKSRKYFQFESLLVEAIILYKYRLKNKNIEIPVKNKEEKIGEEEIINNNASEDKSSSLSGKVIEGRNNEMITFYYYDNEFIDLILLEKICNDVNLKETLDYYCTEKNMIDEYNYHKEGLMKVILNMKTECKLLMSYYKGENKILHEQFIQNDMEKFIILLKTRFTKRDFNTIYSMKKYLYRKMNEIYSDDLYYDEEALYEKKNLSFVEQFTLIDSQHSAYKNFSIYSFLNSLIYLYPRYPKKTCVLYYKIVFKLLSQRCKLLELEENPYSNLSYNNQKIHQKTSKKEIMSYSQTKAYNIEEKYIELDRIIEGFIELFSRKVNRNVIQEDDEFFLMINSLIEFLKELKRKNLYLMKRGPLITKLFTALDFVFYHLFHDFEKIINFMKSAENQKLKDKFKKMETNLKIIIIFISSILSLQKASDNNLLTKNIIEFIQNLNGQIIKLILILIEIGKEDSMKTCNMLLDFIYFFIEGPNINNLKTLFSYGFFDLLTFIITKIDYYKMFLNNINRINLHNIMDNYAKIEQKIIKIFFVYYNLVLNNTENINEYVRIREWYEKNIIYIKIKLKKLYHFSNVEMEKRYFNIDRALLYKKINDNYSQQELFLRNRILNKSEIDEISFEEELNKMLDKDNLNELKNNVINNNDNDNNYIKNNYINENQNTINSDIYENNKNNTILLYSGMDGNQNNNNYCLIKFDLILIYYSLSVYYKDIINEEYFELEDPTDSLLKEILHFCSNFAFFVRDIIFSIPELIFYLYRQLKERAKPKVDLMQELNNIDEDIQSINEKEMLLNLSSKIKCVEISINQILYKVYFPLINNAKEIEEKADYYLYVGNDDLPDYISYLIKNYDQIYISVTKNNYFDKLSKIPMLNLIFKNINLFGIFLMLIGIASNLLILLSYSDFNNDSICDCGDKCIASERRLYCPRFLFNDNRNYTTINRTLRIFGVLQLLFQSMVVFDYIIRNFTINYALSKNNYIIKKAKQTHHKSIVKITFSEYLKIILIAFLKMFNFKFIYYILYIIFILLGLLKHPFFYVFSLSELLNRVKVMLSVLKAIYAPGFYLLVNLLMVIMFEYIFSLFSLSFFTSHFPNIKDCKNFLQTFMRMFDQTFKQDGGIGTYLDQSLNPDYEEYTPKYYAGARYWFDLIFYICFILLIFQVFTSIIIDYFVDSIKNREDFSKKSKTECLICGLKREKIEKIYQNIKDGFNKHTIYCHHIMNYINYLFYVQSLSYKDPIIEQGIWNYHLDNKNIFLPIQTCFQMKERKILKNINAKKDSEEKY